MSMGLGEGGDRASRSCLLISHFPSSLSLSLFFFFNVFPFYLDLLPDSSLSSSLFPSFFSLPSYSFPSLFFVDLFLSFIPA